MESRWVYRGIEEASETGRFSDERFPHSIVSRQLRYMYRAYRDSRFSFAAYYVATSSLLSHPRTKFDAAHGLHDELTNAMFDRLPYLAAEKARVDSDRENSVKVFNEAIGELEELAAKLEEIESKEPGRPDPNKIDI